MGFCAPPAPRSLRRRTSGPIASLAGCVKGQGLEAPAESYPVDESKDAEVPR